MIKAKYFKEAEFQRCSPSCSLQDMDQELMDKIDELREKAGIPLVLNSAYRSKTWDLDKGRTGDSAHTRGLAVDIRCSSSANRLKIVQVAIKVGFCRIGVANSFIHVDIDKSLPQNVLWTY